MLPMSLLGNTHANSSVTTTQKERGKQVRERKWGGPKREDRKHRERERERGEGVIYESSAEREVEELFNAGKPA